MCHLPDQLGEQPVTDREPAVGQAVRGELRVVVRRRVRPRRPGPAGEVAEGHRVDVAEVAGEADGFEAAFGPHVGLGEGGPAGVLLRRQLLRVEVGEGVLAVGHRERLLTDGEREVHLAAAVGHDGDGLTELHAARGEHGQGGKEQNDEGAVGHDGGSRRAEGSRVGAGRGRSAFAAGGGAGVPDGTSRGAAGTTAKRPAGGPGGAAGARKRETGRRNSR